MALRTASVEIPSRADRVQHELRPIANRARCRDITQRQLRAINNAWFNVHCILPPIYCLFRQTKFR